MLRLLETWDTLRLTRHAGLPSPRGILQRRRPDDRRQRIPQQLLPVRVRAELRAQRLQLDVLAADLPVDPWLAPFLHTS